MSTQLRIAKPNPTISIVIPARNEARNLEMVLPELPEVHEVILVDGNSTDGTIETALRVMPSIRVIHQTRKGKGNALVCGFRAATGDVIVMFDADGSADPAEIPAYIETLVRGADFAKGSRFCDGGGSHDITRYRSGGNKGLNILTNLLLKTKYTDLCYGYNAFWSDILDSVDLPDPDIAVTNASGMMWGDGFEIETVLNCRIAAAKLAVHEVPSVERSRIHGESNLNAIRDGLRVLKTILEEKGSARRMAREVAAIRKLETARRRSVGADNEPASVEEAEEIA
ncbi:glycosyltransferase involved in cell wall bisynthesis [Jatrophihabitans sp. GAS493]|uniref:glycosyltransferase family 2 protein n=1 Tax=Jatrophihabitans sp. GAS493 TaxID=1907575 RepID=UPI000BB7481A|nr:glycosyltransferase family 2 protein [Jatrophihabitans sp. GAS493]SOD71599.1 glycosyltransferase involved in cell wall bisynthesis [Jatrophihabitans sp. GAS493]